MGITYNRKAIIHNMEVINNLILLELKWYEI